MTARPGGARRHATPPTGAAARQSAPTASPTSRPCRRCSTRRAAFRDLARASRARSGVRGRHAAVTAVPHGAKSYLVAALALAEGGQRLLDRPGRGDRRPGRRRARGLAWRPGGRGRPGAAVRARLRAERAHPRTSRPPGWPRSPGGGVVGRGSSWRRSRRSSSRRSSRPTSRPARASSAAATGSARTRCSPSSSASGTSPSSKWPAGARWPAAAASSTSSRPAPTLPARIELFGDEIDEIRLFDPDRPADRPHGRRRRASAGQRVPGPGRGTRRRSAPGWGGSPTGCRSGSPPTLPAWRVPARPADAIESAAAAGRPARLDVGDAAEVWSAVVCPASGLDHLAPDTLLVVDEPGEVAAAAEFLWEQAAERRRDLVAAGELPGTWPSAYVEPRAWKARLLGARTLELTWESGPVDGDRRRARASDDPFGWREPVLPPGRSAGLARAIERWGGPAGPGAAGRSSSPRTRPTRLAELLGRGRDPGRASRWPRAPRRRAPSRWSGAA